MMMMMMMMMSMAKEVVGSYCLNFSKGASV
jgi:hypothetical protein